MRTPSTDDENEDLATAIAKREGRRKVYVVRWTDKKYLSSNGFKKICSTKEKAEKYVADQFDKTVNWSIEVWDLD